MPGAAPAHPWRMRMRVRVRERADAAAGDTDNRRAHRFRPGARRQDIPARTPRPPAAGSTGGASATPVRALLATASRVTEAGGHLPQPGAGAIRGGPPFLSQTLL